MKRDESRSGQSNDSLFLLSAEVNQATTLPPIGDAAARGGVGATSLVLARRARARPSSSFTPFFLPARRGNCAKSHHPFIRDPTSDSERRNEEGRNNFAVRLRSPEKIKSAQTPRTMESGWKVSRFLNDNTFTLIDPFLYSKRCQNFRQSLSGTVRS